MAKGAETPSNLSDLVDRMFDQVFSDSERAELLILIREWEAANPDVAPAHRVTAWIDIAYAFQSGSASEREVRNPVRKAARSDDRVTTAPSTV